MTKGRRALLVSWLFSIPMIAACNNNTPSSPDYRGTGGGVSSSSSTGGAAGSGGSGGGVGNGGSGGSEGSGGQIGTGGSHAGTGGSLSGTGGELGGGGMHGTGGTAAAGASGTGGNLGSGGMPGTGGNTITGGSGAGGKLGSGGVNGTGGTTAAGGASGGSTGLADAGTSHDAGKVAEAGAGDTPSTVSYATQIAPLLQASCTSCHGGSNPQSGINLSTYAGVKANASAANSAIKNGTMPPGGALSSANKQLFQTWIDQGALNN